MTEADKELLRRLSQATQARPLPAADKTTLDSLKSQLTQPIKK